MPRTRLAYLLVIVVQTGCTTLGGGILKDSVLSKSNPAPEALAPPDYAGNSANVNDVVQQKSQADYHFTLGEALSFEGKSEKAIEEFKLTLVYDSTSETVRLRLAAEYVRLGMLSEAVEQGEAIVKQNPQNIDARLFLGGLYTGLKLYDQAADQFRYVMDKSDNHPEAAIYLGAIMAEKKDYESAIKLFEGLIKNPKFESKEKVYLYIGKVQMERGKDHYTAAEQAFLTGLKLKPDNAELALTLGGLYKAEEKPQKMVTLWRSFQDRFGPDRDISRGLSRYYLDGSNYDLAIEQLKNVESFEKDNLSIRVQIALILIEQKKYQEAIPELENILEQAPELDKIRFYLAAVHEEMGHSNEAIANYQLVPVASSFFVDSTVHAAHLLKENGNAEEAVEYVRDCIARRDDAPQLYAYYATLLDGRKQYQEAIKMLSVAVTKFPKNTQLRFYLGSMYDRVGNLDATIAEMKKVLTIDEQHVQAMNFLAYTYAENGRELKDAEELARKALQKDPNDGYILDTMGWVMFKQGRMEDAIKFLEAAYRNKSSESIIAEHLGDAYLRYELWQKARRMYNRAAELETDYTKSERIRDKLANVESQSQKLMRAPASDSAQ